MSILIGLSAIADKIRIPYPILLVAIGLIVGFVPSLPDLALNPDVVFLIFLPPLLHDAASHTSWHDFRSAIRPITTLAITLVFFTTTSVAIAAHYCIPGFSWPLAFVLGAIVSPPDAVAASSITKGLGLNKRVITILEGESLLNDASALIAYRYAVAAVTSGSFILWKMILKFIDRDLPANMETKLRKQFKKKYQLAVAYLRQEVRDHISGINNEEDNKNLELTPLSQMMTAQLEISKFQRELLIRYHKQGVFSDEVIRKVEQELDIEHMRLNNLIESQSKVPV